ncbi:hypothetical protein EJ05DRAFT_478701 [Pseudovirgaria hyperparasitica]|uniref:Uncharacterized protein n=1 Tax=Pseudovirgaria hyperparasitica TaxID=470096 RepID=A0A6A6W0W4_9PEZI|nr:uncharacterized protein EJ05DRAFT_478701 [Pseudovirgaria hyperparasitica]KAF2755736.1 hypothetical protein EJ05DRAFT_478701 [Pseudovirgaria hyperparasitica]
MFTRNSKRLLLPAAACLIFIFTFLFHSYFENSLGLRRSSTTSSAEPTEETGDGTWLVPNTTTPSLSREEIQDLVEQIAYAAHNALPNVNEFPPTPSTHRELRSLTSQNGAYWEIHFAHRKGLNPNIIPHSYMEDTWYIVAQALRPESSPKDSVWSTEIVCNAAFKNGELVCDEPPTILPITNTKGGDKCVGELSYFGFNVGPRDARVFYGPEDPYIIFGSNSWYTCMGMFIQDFRVLVDWGLSQIWADRFKFATELQRPPPYGYMEKNFFLFWDKYNNMYVHNDISPKRVFAMLQPDGSVSKDLAPLARTDAACMAKYMPKMTGEKEKIHQATNSLSITLCDRADTTCKQTDDNTFIMAIFQHKTYIYMHAVYEPHVALFSRAPPFALHALSTKPFWLLGRKGGTNVGRDFEGDPMDPVEGSEMIYISSMSWKTHGQKYHGYQDDVLFVGFGIEDQRTAAIDIKAGDLLKDLGFCLEK